jgi:hypothetical protein
MLLLSDLFLTYQSVHSYVMVPRKLTTIKLSLVEKRVYGPGSFGSLVPVAEPGSITRDQCRSRFQHEPGPIGLHVDALQGRSPWVNGPGS